MSIDEKLIKDEKFRKKSWDRIKSDEEFKKEFLIAEMKRTIIPDIYDKMKKTFGANPEDNYKWYFNKSLDLGKGNGKSPYECCLDNDLERLYSLLGAIEYGTYL